MADTLSYQDDISALWGPEGEGVLGSAPANAADHEQPVPAPADGNGAHPTVVERETHDDIARLAEAIAASHLDAVSQADLAAARTEIEGAFTHQLAVALYELMAATNARFATAEDHINQRVTAAVEAQTDRLAASIDAQQRASAVLEDTMRSQLDAIRERITGPIDGLASFQRDLRHDVGRLSDVVTTQGEESAHRATVDADRFERSETRAGAALSELSGLSETLAALQADMAELRQELAQVREAVVAQHRKPRRVGRRGRTG